MIDERRFRSNFVCLYCIVLLLTITVLVDGVRELGADETRIEPVRGNTSGLQRLLGQG
jgi:hypothetical protein